MMNLFTDRNVNQGLVKEKSELVWGVSTFGVNTNKYFQILNPIPTDDVSLTATQN